QEPAKKKPTTKNNPFINQAEENLRSYFHTTVKIKHSNKKGKIELSYYSEEDLQRLLDMLQGQSS
ncbi:MAG: stage 0 sporulation protein J, partial [Gorillibacterium sp.]|nr:stage 0 sporulation protein J [Gorillibacterium sp.]